MITKTLRTFIRHVIERAQYPVYEAARQKIDTIEEIRSRHADFSRLRKAVCESGTDNMNHFQNGYTHEGGLYLQQNPDEFVSLCLYLREHKPYHNYLEIGSASGGACLFMNREVGFTNVWSLDDGQHPRAVEQKKNFGQVENFQQFLGDSHSEEAKQFLQTRLSEKLDIAFIDGDHSYEGAWKDVELVLPHCRPGTLMLLHDTVACPEVRQVWKKAINDKLIDPKAEYVGDYLPLGIGIGTVR